MFVFCVYQMIIFLQFIENVEGEEDFLEEEEEEEEEEKEDDFENLQVENVDNIFNVGGLFQKFMVDDRLDEEIDFLRDFQFLLVVSEENVVIKLVSVFELQCLL